MTWQIRPVVLSGGSGTRLWPVSRKRYPKQFANLVGDENLFTGTLRTVLNRDSFAAPMIIGNAEHRFLVQDALERLQIKDAEIFLEPQGRNTAVAAYIAALADEAATKASGTKMLHLVMPSDHVITNKAAFMEAIAKSQSAVEAGKIVLFGVEPTRPDTGFGYIMCGTKILNDGVKEIAKFCEKPKEGVAKTFIEQGGLWNSGIFFYDPQILLAEAERLAPEELALCREAFTKAQKSVNGMLLGKESYVSMGNQPFDRAIMEKTDKGAVIACNMGWSDLGSWEALWQIEPKDERENAAIGPVVSRDIDGCYIRSYGPTVAVMGVSDLAIIATKDSVLVAPRARAQEVRELVDDVGHTNELLANEHPRVMRPWGSYEGIAQGDRFQVKHIVVLPGRSLSLQMHHHRAEHWIVVAGTAKIECNGEEKLIFPNESVYIPSGAKHRLTNPGKVELHLIEVQSGDYLGEDDIVRFEDHYGRTGAKVS